MEHKVKLETICCGRKGCSATVTESKPDEFVDDYPPIGWATVEVYGRSGEEDGIRWYKYVCPEHSRIFLTGWEWPPAP
jgi:hypothetical protein